MSTTLESQFRHARNVLYEGLTREDMTLASLQQELISWQTNHPHLAKILKPIDQQVGLSKFLSIFARDGRESGGISKKEYSIHVLKTLHIDVHWDAPIPSYLTQSTQPVLIYGNHYNRIEQFALNATTQRAAHPIGATWTSLFGNDQDIHLVMRVPAKKKTIQFRNTIYGRDEAIAFNRTSYINAATHMAQNGAVLIFPNATHIIRENTYSWKGIGRLVENLDEESLRNTMFAPLYIYGVTISDVLSNVRSVLHGSELKTHTMHINQGTPFTGESLLLTLQESERSGIPTYQRISNALESLYTQDREFSSIQI